MRLLLTIFCLTYAMSSAAQSKTTFGSDNAALCYQESNAPLSDYGLRYCTNAIRKDNLLPRDLAATYTNRGIIHAATSQLEKAMQDHNEALRLTPGVGKIYINRGNVFHQTRKYDKALADYARAVELAKVPLDIVYYNKALTLIKLKRWDDARESLEQALAINPDSTRVKQKLDQFNAPQEKPRAVVVDPGDTLEQ